MITNALMCKQYFIVIAIVYIQLTTVYNHHIVFIGPHFQQLNLQNN